MKPGILYRHMSCLDADMLVTSVRYRGSRYTKLDIHWFVRGMWLGDDKVTVWHKDLWKWKEVTNAGK